MSLTGMDPVLLLCLERSEIHRKGTSLFLEDYIGVCVFLLFRKYHTRGSAVISLGCGLGFQDRGHFWHWDPSPSTGPIVENNCKGSLNQ